MKKKKEKERERESTRPQKLAQKPGNSPEGDYYTTKYIVLHEPAS